VENSITEIAFDFIKKICEQLCMGKKFFEVEWEIFKETQACAARLVSAYFEMLENKVLADKAGRKEMGYIRWFGMGTNDSCKP